MSPTALHLKADRIGTLVMYIGALIAAVILVPLAGFISQKLTTVPQMVMAGAATAVIGGGFVYYRLRQIGLEWVELTDEALTVGINKQAYRIAWAEMTKVVQNFDPEEEWYIYTTAPSPAMRFDPGPLSFDDRKAMREFIKDKVGYTTETDPAYVTRHSR